jgi:ubiquitin carboxyl-terminal hydrolase 36/42
MNGITNGVRMNGTLSPGGRASKETSENDEKPNVNGDISTVNGDKAAENAEEKHTSTAWPQIYHRPPGLKNFSNTCYMNSTLQALMHIPPLVTHLLRGNHGSLCIVSVLILPDWLGSKNSQVCAFCRLERHARESYEGSKKFVPLEPQGIIGKAGGTSFTHRYPDDVIVLNKFYNVHKQEDAHELFLHLLDKMEEADKRAHHDPKHKSVIQDIFGGECRQSITCDMEDCLHVSHTSQAFMDLSLDLLTRERDIMSSLHDFTRQETLSHDNQYKCEKYFLPDPISMS